MTIEAQLAEIARSLFPKTGSSPFCTVKDYVSYEDYLTGVGV